METQPNRKFLGAAIGVIAIVLLFVGMIGFMIGRHAQRPIVVKAPAIVQQAIMRGTITIGWHDNLTKHVSYQEALDLAERHGLDVYAGKGQARHRVTPEQARLIDTARTRVTIVVVRGDRFDLDRGTFYPSPRRTMHGKTTRA